MKERKRNNNSLNNYLFNILFWIIANAIIIVSVIHLRLHNKAVIFFLIFAATIVFIETLDSLYNKEKSIRKYIEEVLSVNKTKEVIPRIIQNKNRKYILSLLEYGKTFAILDYNEEKIFIYFKSNNSKMYKLVEEVDYEEFMYYYRIPK